VGRGLCRGELLQPLGQHLSLTMLDITFGDNIDGVGGKAGMRVS
jgi:hypothetical protein